MLTGTEMLANMPEVIHEPLDYRWNAPSYESVAPSICIFRNMLVHSGVGILCTDRIAIAESLLLTAATQHHYSEHQETIMLHSRQPVQRLRGRWLSLLSGSHDNYYHWTLDCLGRLAAADKTALEDLDGVLTPVFTEPFQPASYLLTGLPIPRQIAVDETVYVDELIVPWMVSQFINHRPHPCIRPFFERLFRAAGSGGPRRIYVDRRGAANRSLRNENEVIAALAPLGFVPMRLEKLSLADQMGLFRHAEAIVAPHGAGLANLVYARPGCRVLELHSDSWACWCFRHLAAIFDLQYDCVIGRQVPGQQIIGRTFRAWSVSTIDVVAAVQRMLQQSQA
jgi:capsular polysaccharide biosynthesis protein